MEDEKNGKNKMTNALNNVSIKQEEIISKKMENPHETYPIGKDRITI